MLLLQNISLKRSNIEIFNDINLSLSKGKVVSLKGKNGSGKTSLIKIMLNLLEPTSGTIYWKGKNIKKNLYSFYDQVTYVPDKTTSLKNLTVEENIKIWKKISLSDIGNNQITNILKTLKLENYIYKKVNSLSLGETKKLELLRLIIENRKFWILDEPFTNLDTESINIMEQTFDDHRKNDGCIFFSTHQRTEIGITDEIIL